MWVASAYAPFARIGRTTVEDFDRVHATSLRGPYLLARAVVPGMIERAGRLLVLGSAVGSRGGAGQAALPNADAIGWVPSSGRFLHAAGGMVFVSTFEGTPVIRFDTPGMNVTGMAADPSDPTAFWVQSYGNVERIVLPRLTEDPSISGRFGSATATVYLWDRGEGKVTGTALVGGDTLPLFGELSGGGGTLVMGTITGAGAPTIVSVTVSADLQTLTAPPPVGVLTRQ